ncbi:MAG TPA: hypothetical protein DCQ29_09440 [Chitinophagaceae bacterium]|nr:hypothetical protein [Chitinophagaceae bacterium]
MLADAMSGFVAVLGITTLWLTLLGTVADCQLAVLFQSVLTRPLQICAVEKLLMVHVGLKPALFLATTYQ